MGQRVGVGPYRYFASPATAGVGEDLIIDHMDLDRNILDDNDVVVVEETLDILDAGNNQIVTKKETGIQNDALSDIMDLTEEQDND